jgi:hypothetical protein
VPCPTRWPPRGGSAALETRAFSRTVGSHLINVDNAFSRHGGHVFHLLLGGQRRPSGRWPSGVDSALRLTTRRVTIPIRGGGTFLPQSPARPSPQRASPDL